jgi:hypothetical protein
MDMATLREGYKKILRSIYAPEVYYQRVRSFLRDYRPPKIKTRLELQHVLAFLRSIYLLGIKGVERVQYWRLVLWTLLRRPRAFPLAMTLAIYGYHFRKVNELHVQ